MRLHRTIVSTVCAGLAFAIAGCAAFKKSDTSGQPTPIEDVESIDAQQAAQVVQSARTAQAPAAPITQLPVLPDPASFGPVGKPRIVAKVEAVQFPAWIERGGVRASIKAGWALYTGDRITTGSDGRVALGVAGEGQLKVGGNADVTFTPAYENPEGRQPPMLTVNRGPFHFTAPMVRSVDGGTGLIIGAGIHANVLGGALYGRADPGEDVLLLLNGGVQVGGPKLNPGTMTKDDTWIRVPRAGRASPVSEATQDRVARWLGQTQLVSGRPTLKAEGVWDVSVNSGYNLKQLETMACRWQNRGYPSEIYPVREPGKQVWYRVVVRRFASKNDAVSFLGTAKALGSSEPWVLLPQS